jgi:hypothetical protein
MMWQGGRLNDPENHIEYDPDKESLEYILDPDSYPSEGETSAAEALNNEIPPWWKRFLTALIGKKLPLGSGPALVSMLGGVLVFTCAFLPIVNGKLSVSTIRFTSLKDVFYSLQTVKYSTGGVSSAWVPTGIWPLFVGAMIALLAFRCTRSFSSRKLLLFCRSAVVALSIFPFVLFYQSIWVGGSDNVNLSLGFVVVLFCGSALALVGSSLMLGLPEFRENRIFETSRDRDN